MKFNLLPWRKTKIIESPQPEYTSREKADKYNAIVKLIKQGPKVSEPDSAINQAHNNQRFIDAVRGMVE